MIDMLTSVIEYRSLESGQHIRRIGCSQILLEDVAENYQVYNLDSRKIQLITEASSCTTSVRLPFPTVFSTSPES